MKIVSIEQTINNKNYDYLSQNKRPKYSIKIVFECDVFTFEHNVILNLCWEINNRFVNCIEEGSSYIVVIDILDRLDDNDIYLCLTNATSQMIGIDSADPAIKFLSLLCLKYF